MRILVVHNAYQQGGGEDAVVAQETAMLREKGHEIRLFSVDNKGIGNLWQKAYASAFATYNPFSRRRIAQEIRAFAPDVAHVHNFFPLLSPSIFDAFQSAGVPSLMTLHNFRILCPTAFLYHQGSVREESVHGSCWWTVRERTYRDSLLGTLSLAVMVETHKRLGTWNRTVDKLVALTQFAKNKFVEGGIDERRIVVKDNFCHDLGRGKATQRNRQGAIFVGRLSDEKGVAELIEAWRDIDYPLRIAGDGPLGDALRSRAGTNVHFLGRLSRPELADALSSSLFLVLPSKWYEMFPVVIPEAFSCSLPIVGAASGGIKELVSDGETGLHFDARDIGELARKCRWAIANADEMAKMGRNARAVYERRFTPGTNYSALMDIYHNAIESKATQTA